jgi:hypothetical protein
MLDSHLSSPKNAKSAAKGWNCDDLHICRRVECEINNWDDYVDVAAHRHHRVLGSPVETSARYAKSAEDRLLGDEDRPIQCV